jgi:signal transduction histidine kinase
VDAEGLRQALKGGEALRTVSYEGESLRVYSVPFVREGEVVGAVQLTRELREVDALMASQLMTLLLALPVAGLAAAGAAVALANRALRPIAIATRTASEIGGADLSRRLEVVGDDEMADLARTFNAMLARLEHAFVDIGTANERLARALESQRRFTADASHELRTPLTRLRLAIDSAVLDGDPERMRDALGIAARSSGQMARLVDQLLTLARVDAGQLPVRRERLDLRIVAAEALDSVTRADRVEAHFPSEAVAVEADPDHVRRIAVNLLENALRHTAEGRSVRLWVRPASGQAELVVADEGEGIPAEAVGRVFERFFRVDESRTGGGSGLGLAICRDLARANGGDLTLASELGVGTRAVLHLPVVTHRAIAARNDGS